VGFEPTNALSCSSIMWVTKNTLENLDIRKLEDSSRYTELD
jgi:hypothetical protein